MPPEPPRPAGVKAATQTPATELAPPHGAIDLRDLSRMTEEQRAVMVLEQVMRMSEVLRRLQSTILEFKKEYDEDRGKVAAEFGRVNQRIDAELGRVNERIDALEGSGGLPKAPPARAPLESYDDLRDSLMRAGIRLSERVKDPKDKMDSTRARAIALETMERVRGEEDAESWRAMKRRARKVAWEVSKALIPFLVGMLVYRYGLVPSAQPAKITPALPPSAAHPEGK